jgi:diguanylate cyclase (GGDEF)-like protein
MDLPPLRGVDRALIVARDVTLGHTARAEVERLAIHDALTGLPNRALLRDRLERALARAGEADRPAVLYLNLDRFKDVNDAFGHVGGDRVLATVGARLRDAVGPLDSVGRYEGDEFVVVLAAGNDAALRAHALLEVIGAGITVSDRLLYPEATVGIAIAPEHGQDPETLIRRAEAAMYHAKGASLPVGVYAAEQERRGGARIDLLSDLRHAIERRELWLAYQPIVSMSTGGCVTVESLLRWQHPTRGPVPPMDFIPLAEESGLIRQLGIWVLEEAARTSTTWGRGGPGVSVNLSMRNLEMPELLSAIASTLEEHRLPRGGLTIEVTESLLMIEPERVKELLRALQQLGVRASVDDYGTGYSSLAYLKELPVRELKIDRAFVHDMATNTNSAAIVRSTIDLAHDLGLLVVAEGIEDQGTWDRLEELGCDLAQGYFIARPMQADLLALWLRERVAGTALSR